MQPQRLTHCEQYCFSKVHIHYPSKPGKLSISVTMVSKIIKSIKVYFKYVGMHTYKLNVLCFCRCYAGKTNKQKWMEMYLKL